MKTLLQTALAVFAAGTAFATEEFYINDGVITFPPQIDAYNFINRGSFYVTNSNVGGVFSTANTLTFTNQNLMSAHLGFRFDTAPSGSGVFTWASNFANLNSVNPQAAKIYGGERIIVNATNIINRGLLDVGQETGQNGGTGGLLSLKGKNVDLSRGTLRVEGFNPATNGVILLGNFAGTEPGIFDNYWGFGRCSDGNFASQVYQTPFHIVTNVFNGAYNTFVTSLALSNTFVTNRMQLYQTGATNYLLVAVYVGNDNTNLPVDIRFFTPVPYLRWHSVLTNRVSGFITTNDLYLVDTMILYDPLGTPGSPPDPLRVTPHFPYAASLPVTTYQPENYSLFRLDPFGGYESLDPGLEFDPLLVDPQVPPAGGDYTAYSASLQARTWFTNSLIPGPSVTNLSGRIEITADELNLTRTRIDGLNYLSIQASNFLGSAGANITAAFNDLNLRSTNGVLATTNLLQRVPRLNGQINCFSGRYTNSGSFQVNGENVEIAYHLLFVDSHLQEEAPPFVRGLTLRATNSNGTLNDVFINDAMNIYETCTIECERLNIMQTITDLGFTQTTNTGELNFLNLNMRGTNTFPRLQFLTNSGRLYFTNSAHFIGARRSPYFTNTFNEPYQVFANYGSVEANSATIWATDFSSTGSIQANNGPIVIQTGTASVVGATEPATLRAFNGDIIVTGTNVVLNNSILDAGRKISFAISGQFADTSSNELWTTHDGFDLLVKPATGDLLGTTVSNRAYPSADIVNTWAGEDRGLSAAGYANNMAIGKLVLDAGLFSLFTFRAAGVSNAMYVDYLELDNYATNYLDALAIDPNFTLYFADANLPPNKLDGRFNNHLRWVQGYAGVNSSTNVALRGGGYVTVNRVLARSSSIDSDGDGIANSVDAFPFDGPQVTTAVTGVSTNPPSVQFSISWKAASNTVYAVQYTTNLVSWGNLTTVSNGSTARVVTIQDSVPASSPRFYRVRYSP
jgi:hypothetical protein